MSEPKFTEFLPTGKEYRYAREQVRTAYFFFSTPQTFASMNLWFEPREAFLLQRIQVETDRPTVKGVDVHVRSAGHGMLLYKLDASLLLEEYVFDMPAFFAHADTVQIVIDSDKTPIVGEIQVHLIGTVAIQRPEKIGKHNFVQGDAGDGTYCLYCNESDRHSNHIRAT